MAETIDNLLINNFYETARDLDFSRDIHFRVTQIVPDPALGLGNFMTEKELVYAKSAKLPQRQIQNVEAKYMGLQFNLPGVATYPDSANYSIEFYCDSNSTLRNKFEAWSRALFNDENSTGNYNIPTQQAYIQLAQLNPAREVVQQYKLVGASIRTIGELDYKMAEGTGAVMSFNATIAYHYYELV